MNFDLKLCVSLVCKAYQASVVFILIGQPLKADTEEEEKKRLARRRGGKNFNH